MPEQDLKPKLLAYLKGWSHGAGRNAIATQDNPDYMRGYQEGQAAHRAVAERMQAEYGVKLAVVRTTAQSGEPHCVDCKHPMPLDGPWRCSSCEAAWAAKKTVKPQVGDPVCIRHPEDQDIEAGWDGEGWYFHAEGGELHGPFSTRAECQQGARYYLEDTFDDGGL